MRLTARATLAEAAHQLAETRVPEPALDAELLLRHVLGWDRAQAVARAGDELPDEAVSRYRAVVERRAARIPLQHLVGSVHFWRHEFLVSPAALIPRPETELLVETALELVRATSAPRIADVGTGTGCIALSLAAERPDASLYGIDISAAALALAAENARRLSLERRLSLHQGDLLAPLEPLHGHLDLIVSNPPYLDASELQELQPEVRDHEPRLALVPPGGDRFSLYARLAPAAARALALGGCLAVEIGLGMDDRVTSLLAGAGLTVERSLPDLQRIPRVVIARRTV